MSKLDVLIRELCSNGVEAIRLKEVLGLQYGQGNNIPITIGDYPVYGSNGIVGNTNEFNSEDSPIIGHIGSAGYVQWGQGKHYVTYNGIIVKCKADKIIPRYAYHLLIKMNLPSKIKGSQPFISYDDVYKIKVQIPPLEVQQEIVRILDNFTMLIAELTAEHMVRKTQFQIYLNKLLTFDKDTQEFRIGDVITLLNGKAFKQDELLIEGKYPVLRVGNFYTNSSWYYSNLELDDKKYCKKGDLLYSWAATLGPKIWHGEKSIYHYHIWKVLINESLVDKMYLYYYFQYDLQKISSSTTNSTMIHISMGSMNERTIKLPSLLEQRKIVRYIEAFDTLVNDIKQGLPAEIAARQKQYEYYRDKLLTFKEVGDESI